MIKSEINDHILGISERDKLFSFQVKTPSRTYYLQAESTAEK